MVITSDSLLCPLFRSLSDTDCIRVQGRGHGMVRIHKYPHEGRHKWITISGDGDPLLCAKTNQFDLPSNSPLSLPPLLFAQH